MKCKKPPLPESFFSLDAEQQRRIIVEDLAADFMADRPDAWYHLLSTAVRNDPHIPQEAKTKLQALLVHYHQGEVDRIDRHSRTYRQEETLNADIYSAVMRIGGNKVDAVKKVAARFGICERTVRDRYKAHVQHWDEVNGIGTTPTLDGRRKSKAR